MIGARTASCYRRAAPEDGPLLRLLHERAIRVLGRTGYSAAECESWAEGLLDERYGEAMAEGETFELAFTADGRLAGFCSWRQREILALFVDPDLARTGVASGLVDRAEAAIAAQGFPRIVVGAALSGVPFYEQRGYRVDERHVWTTRGGLPLEVAWMSKDLLRPRGVGPKPESPLQRLRRAGVAALPGIISNLERDRFSQLALEDAAWVDPRGRAVGLVGPPGCGKSRLIELVVAELRARDRKVVTLRIGGLDEETVALVDADGYFSQVLSPRDVSSLLQPIVVLARAVFDVVVIEATVPTGMDQLALSACDLTLLALQPTSEDCVALMEAGLMARPDQALMLKSDSDAETAPMLARLAALAHGKLAPLMVSSVTRQNLPAVIDLFLDRCSGEAERRHRQARGWIVSAIQEERGRYGLAYMEAHLRRLVDDARLSPSHRVRNILDAIARQTA
ncbi:Putative protein kinase ArgK [Arboricoccus pini]|uniref:N-acetyltransferase domain-containing protein n=1 Tax=Arboricoccus pini TaxID=1963835 RepID=A0A212QN39_9PROT|nr:Putative protein kinase ArgK [Arboricoccus pini]